MVKFIDEEKAEKNRWSLLSSDIGNMENRFEQSGFNCVQVCSKACSLQKQIRWNSELLKMDAMIKYLETLGRPGG